MRTILFLIAALASLRPVQAQDAGAAPIQLLLSPTTLGRALPAQNRDRLDRQLLSVLGADDTGGLNSRFSSFAVSPALDLLEQGKIEGLKTQVTAKVNLQLKLVNTLNGEVLGVEDVVLTGAGANLDEAVSRALSNVRRSNSQLGKQLAAFRDRVGAYYDQHCAEVLAAAADLAARRQYREAFATLHAVPAGHPCAATVLDKKQAYFAEVQQQQCAGRLHQARTAAAANNFGTALQLLSEIDAAAPCFDEAKKTVLELESRLDEDQQRRYDWLFKFYREGQSAETARYQAMTAVALAALRDGGKVIIK